MAGKNEKARERQNKEKTDENKRVLFSGWLGFPVAGFQRLYATHAHGRDPNLPDRQPAGARATGPAMWSVVGSLEPSLTWSYPNASCNPQGYAIDLRTGPLFTDHLGGGTGNPSTSWGPGSPLQPGKEYEWLVQAINGTTLGPRRL